MVQARYGHPFAYKNESRWLLRWFNSNKCLKPRKCCGADERLLLEMQTTLTPDQRRPECTAGLDNYRSSSLTHNDKPSHALDEQTANAALLPRDIRLINVYRVDCLGCAPNGTPSRLNSILA